MNDGSSTLSRRGFLAGSAGASLAVAGGIGVPKAEAAGMAFGPGPLSGLPWHSGCGITGFSTFESYRGRRADSYTIWCQRDTWSDIVSFKGGFNVIKKLPGRVSMAIAPLPTNLSAVVNPGNWRLAATGTFDGYYTGPTNW